MKAMNAVIHHGENGTAQCSDQDGQSFSSVRLQKAASDENISGGMLHDLRI